MDDQVREQIQPLQREGLKPTLYRRRVREIDHVGFKVAWPCGRREHLKQKPEEGGYGIPPRHQVYCQSNVLLPSHYFLCHAGFCVEVDDKSS